MNTYLRSFRDSFKTSPGLMTLLTVLVFGTCLNAFIPLATSRLVSAAQECINTGAGAELIWEALTLFCILFAAGGLISIMLNTLRDLVIQKGTRAFERRLFKKMCVIDQIILEDPASLDSYKLASEAAFSQDNICKNAMIGLVMISLTLLSDVICTGVNIYTLVSFSPYLLIFAVLSTPLSMLISVVSEKARAKLRRSQAQKTRETEYFWGLFCRKESVKEMRVFGAQQFLRGKWLTARDAMLNEEVRLNSRILALSNLGEIVKNVFYALNVAAALWLIMRGDISIGEFTACIGVFGSLQITLVSFMYELEYFSKCLHMSEDYYRFLSLGETHDGSAECREIRDCIELENVSFRYPNTENYALKNIDLKISKGEHIVIVGENGSGKTTLSKLITACYMPESGKVTMDGTDIRAYRKSGYLKNISVVSQNFIKYNMTLRENIAVSDTAGINDDTRVEDAAKRAGISDISETIGGFDAELGREFGGAELSGGQWQKVAIARGIFKDAPVIILDEPTAALDPMTEYEILTDFMHISRGKTSIMISHRIGICTAADRVIVMKDGRIVGDGTHTELLNSSEEYKRMWNAQAKYFA